MRKEIGRAMGAASSTPPADPVVEYVARLCASLVLHGFGQAGPALNENWEQVRRPLRLCAQSARRVLLMCTVVLGDGISLL